MRDAIGAPQHQPDGKYALQRGRVLPEGLAALGYSAKFANVRFQTRDSQQRVECRPLALRARRSQRDRPHATIKYGAKICATFAICLRDFCATLREYDA